MVTVNSLILNRSIFYLSFFTPSFELLSVNQRVIINNQFLLELIQVYLHFLTLLPLAQHGLPHLAKNNSFQLIVNDNRFFRGMGIDSSSLYPPKRQGNLVRNKRKSHNATKRRYCNLQTTNPCQAFLKAQFL